jgi:tetratricopeptide (TPR) repeat protein
MRVISTVLLLSALLASAQTDLPQGDALQKGIAEFNRGQYAAAQGWLEKAPDTAERETFLALIRAATGHCDTARQELAGQFAKDAGSELGRLAGLALTQCLLAEAKYDDAVPVLARLRSLHPADADVLYQCARLHMRAWNDTLYEMFRKTPNSYRVNQISAEIFEIQNRYPEAISEYRKAIEKNPTALNLHFRLGRALLLESHSPDNLALAQREFEAELKLNPADAAAEYETGQVLLVSQAPSEAVKHFERAVAITPDFAEALQALAKVRLDAKQYGEAIILLENVVRLQPANESAHYSLMLAYRNAGRSGDAAREQAVLDKLRESPQGEFTDFLKRLGEKAPKQ